MIIAANKKSASKKSTIKVVDGILPDNIKQAIDRKQLKSNTKLPISNSLNRLVDATGDCV